MTENYNDNLMKELFKKYKSGDYDAFRRLMSIYKYTGDAELLADDAKKAVKTCLVNIGKLPSSNVYYVIPNDENAITFARISNKTVKINYDNELSPGSVDMAISPTKIHTGEILDKTLATEIIPISHLKQCLFMESEKPYILPMAKFATFIFKTDARFATHKHTLKYKNGLMLEKIEEALEDNSKDAIPFDKYTRIFFPSKPSTPFDDIIKDCFKSKRTDTNIEK